MGKRIVILGSGFGGLAAANTLRKSLGRDHRITVIDRKRAFMMGLVKLWVLQGSRGLAESQTSLDGLRTKGIEFLNDEVTRIDIASRRVEASNHGLFEYDYLIVALGAELAPERIAGFAGRGYNLYDGAQVPPLRERLLSLGRGRVAISIMGMPYKCPPAPYEASMIINEMLIKKGTRGSIDIDIYTPSQIALPVAGPQASKAVVEIVTHEGINFHPSHKLKAVSDEELEFGNGTTQAYDVLVGIPPHRVPDVVRSAGLTASGEWVSVDRHTLRTSFKDVFAVGDVTEIKFSPTLAIPKAGIFAEAQAKVVAQQIIDEINGRHGDAAFDGRGYCFMEVGNKKAGYIDADFYNQPEPALSLEPPSEQMFQKKQEFERSRIKEWLL